MSKPHQNPPEQGLGKIKWSWLIKRMRIIRIGFTAVNKYYRRGERVRGLAAHTGLKIKTVGVGPHRLDVEFKIVRAIQKSC
jgi:hypothetical protein